MLSEDSDQLAIKALKASTQDREEEDKKLVLTRSTCCTGKADDQKDCCCHNGAEPCYWSSMACDDPNTNDWISLRLNSMVPRPPPSSPLPLVRAPSGPNCRPSAWGMMYFFRCFVVECTGVHGGIDHRLALQGMVAGARVHIRIPIPDA